MPCQHPEHINITICCRKAVEPLADWRPGSLILKQVIDRYARFTDHL